MVIAPDPEPNENALARIRRARRTPPPREAPSLGELFPLASHDPWGFHDTLPSLLLFLASALDHAASGAEDPILAAIQTAAAERGTDGIGTLLAAGDPALLAVVWAMSIEALLIDVLGELWGGPDTDSFWGATDD